MLPFIHFGNLEISTWRIVVLAGIVLCWILFLIRAKRLGYSFYSVFALLLFALPVGTLGGHLFNKIIPVLAGSENPYHNFMGLTAIGSIISVLLFAVIYIKYLMKTNPMQVMDAAAFTFPLSIFIGRIGCLLSGCCYGRVAPESIGGSFFSIFTLPLDSYAPSSDAWHAHQDMPHHTLLWNLPLLFMTEAFVILALTEIIYRRREKWNLYPGTVFASAGAMYAGGRFFIEFLREDELVGNTVLNPWQAATLVLFLFFFFWVLFTLYKRRQNLSRDKGDI